MKKLLRITLFLAAGLAFAACERDDVTVPDEPAYQDIEVADYAEPAIPDGVGGELSYYPAYSGINEAMEYMSENSKDLANMAIAAGASLAGKAIAEYTGVKGLDKAFVALCGKLFPYKQQRSEELLLLDSLNYRMNRISDTLDELTEAVKEVYKKLDESELNDILTRQQNYDRELDLLFILCNETYRELDRCETDQERKDAIIRWSQKNAGGTIYAVAEDLARGVLKYTFNYNSKQYNYLGAFDIYAYSQAPWENQGYVVREAYRAQIAVGLVRALNLTIAYYAMGDDKDGMKTIMALYDKLQLFFEKGKVQRREDVTVCQIAGAHFEIAVKPTIHNARQVGYYGTGWLSDYLYTGNKYLRLGCENTLIGFSEIMKALGDHSWERTKAIEDAALKNVEAVDCDAFIAGQFTKKEIQAVLEHYQMQGLNFLQALQDGGVQGLDAYAKRPQGYEYNEYACIATNETKYEAYLNNQPHENYYESESRLSGYVFGSMPYREFLESCPEMDYLNLHQYPQDTHKDGKIEYYDTFFLLNGNSMAFPGYSCFLFFEPSEIKRLKFEFSPEV